jgi:hypothetical protein
MVDVSRDAAALIEPRATERLIELETGDVDVPAPPGATFRPPLYFRILVLSPTSLRVELWELGKQYGARSVSTVGSDNLKARRLALAAAELARRLRQQRLAEIAAQKAPKSGEDESQKRAQMPIYGRFTWGAEFHGAAIGPSSAWLLGPAIDATLRFSSGPRLSLGAAWLVGQAPEFGSSSSARWAEAAIGYVHGFPLSPSFELSAGLTAAAAAVRIGEPNGPASTPLETWSSRAGLLVRAEMRPARYLFLSAGPDVGVVLSPISATGEDGERHRIGGIWLGGALAVTIDPEGVN